MSSQNYIKKDHRENGIIDLCSHKYSIHAMSQYISVAPESRFAWCGSDLARAFDQKARLGSFDFSKSSYLNIFAITNFLKNFEKDQWQSAVLMGTLPSVSLHNGSRGPFSAKRLIKNDQILSKMAQI